ncbi:MAG: [acyl-carrier-protein] S-malonyltransferase [Alphaproteobacteria bacterium]|nr:[acyl-carrier-protein] S-malonyltransferase [Alphaproteobacteria bacterium]
MRALVFPGQGSQAVGMGQALAEAFPAARHVLQEVDDALGQKLSRLMFTGPGEDLQLTENAQPALMAAALAVFRVLATEGGIACGVQVAFVAGHSLGEYSALAAAEAITLADAARLLRLRGLAMQRAVPVGAGAMAALLGLDLAAAEAAAAEAGEVGVCAVANDNGPGQIVISGTKAAVDRAIEAAKAKGAKRVIPLAVSAPFHCLLLAPAAEEVREALGAITIAPPRVPLVANVTAAPVSDPETIRGLLVEQVTARVRWRESVERLVAEGVGTVVELGTGRVLTGLVKRIDRDLVAFSVETPAEVEAFLKSI